MDFDYASLDCDGGERGDPLNAVLTEADIFPVMGMALTEVLDICLLNGHGQLRDNIGIARHLKGFAHIVRHRAVIGLSQEELDYTCTRARMSKIVCNISDRFGGLKSPSMRSAAARLAYRAAQLKTKKKAGRVAAIQPSTSTQSLERENHV